MDTTKRTYSLLSQVAGIAATAYVVFAVIVGLADIAFILRHHVTYLFGDHWIWWAHFSAHGLRNALFSQHNEHRLFFPGLLYWADVRFFGARNALLIATTIVFNVACIVMLSLPFLRLEQVPRAARLTFFGFVTIAMLWFVQGTNFFYPFQVCLPLANLGILSSLYLFTIFYERESSGKSRPEWFLAGSVICGFVATFSYAHGLLIWPLLLLNAFILRLRLLTFVTLAGAALLSFGLYFRQYVNPPGHVGLLTALRAPLKLASYFILMIGLPWVGAEKQQLDIRLNVLPYAIAVSGIVVAFVPIGIFLLRRAHSQYAIFYSSLLMLAMGSVAATALGRTRFPVSQSLSGRYAPIPLLFWVSLIALLTIYLCRYEVSGGAGRVLWCVGLVAVSLATIPTQFATGYYLAGREKAQEEAVTSIAIGVRDQSTVAVELYPDWRLVNYVDQRTMQLLHRPSFFELPESGLLHTALQSRFHIDGNCDSTVDEARLYRDEQKTGVRFLGWLFDRNQGKSAAKVLVTDQAGSILGLGVTGIPRPDVAQFFRNKDMEEAGWVAYSPLPADGSRRLRVFGEFRASSAVCEVVSPKTSIPE